MEMLYAYIAMTSDSNFSFSMRVARSQLNKACYLQSEAHDHFQSCRWVSSGVKFIKDIHCIKLGFHKKSHMEGFLMHRRSHIMMITKTEMCILKIGQSPHFQSI